MSVRREFEAALANFAIAQTVAQRFARRFTPEGWEKYRAKHPKAKKENHRIVQRRDSSPEGKAKSDAARQSIKKDLEEHAGKKPASSPK